MLARSRRAASCVGGLGRMSASDACLSYLPLSHIAERIFSIHGHATGGFALYYAESIERLADNLRVSDREEARENGEVVEGGRRGTGRRGRGAAAPDPCQTPASSDPSRLSSAEGSAAPLLWSSAARSSR
jgi:hypothetical protein